MEYDKLIFEISKKGRKAYTLPKNDVPHTELKEIIGEEFLRETDLQLPEVCEVDVVRHYTALSNKNYGVDTGFYPLGSCTMKYNPKINEDMAGISKFINLHPYQREETVQGALELMYELSHKLEEITGMDKVVLHPAAGAHGELTGLMLIKAYHESKGDYKRKKIIIPDAAHGTNPASAKQAGFQVVEIKSNREGKVDLESLKAALDDEVAGLMLTNPNTLGLFEKDIKEISKLVHETGGLLYYDGANLNAIMGIARPGDMGFDVVHLNIHKTFSTPHGGGGPGCGPVGVKKKLEDFLPVPVVDKKEDRYFFNYDIQKSIGKVKNFYGNFGVMIKAYSYILTMGAEGLKKASEIAVLNANYLKNNLKKYYKLPIDEVCKHEFVLSGLKTKNRGISTVHVAKRLLDYGYHPPTIYFPLIIDNAIMIEPTETESLETLDRFIEAMKEIAKEEEKSPELLIEAPHSTPVKRLDEVKAARKPILKWSEKNG
ncbi:aminomethyl-transferring glycine dehydrogenase subunit GcvPB [Clostridium ganghwense]|uniref:Probable glycine dehydrogenase (decarboxylating) subunit 2 n=1 Tax=Clostridium ganghwense TaxID=312089 RepID=A0ABT4CS25_9CLOT|nr:aminomethyl-transferring glycine dehydrogenase subunit GcvPB [Clostridium ganghwense]MCY6371021.1 aminomethyl-transferring glycine dehydrogenase subunit GcvPB [Clostridium ganghwense]